MGAALRTSAAARDAALGAGAPPRLRREHHQEGKGGKGGYSLGGVASRSAARSGGIGIDQKRMKLDLGRRQRPFLFGGGLEEAW